MSGKLRKNIIPHDIEGSSYAQAIAGAIGCINLYRPQNRDSHNMRTFEVPAYGGLLISERNDETICFFPENECAIMFSSPEELREKILWVIENREAAEKIRISGSEIARIHSYDDRLNLLLTAIPR